MDEKPKRVFPPLSFSRRAFSKRTRVTTRFRRAVATRRAQRRDDTREREARRAFLARVTTRRPRSRGFRRSRRPDAGEPRKAPARGVVPASRQTRGTLGEEVGGRGKRARRTRAILLLLLLLLFIIINIIIIIIIITHHHAPECLYEVGYCHPPRQHEDRKR